MELNIEYVAVVLGLLCVGFTVRQHLACWPTGLAMVSLYIVIFYHAQLYSDMLLQVVYVGLQCYGWWAWLHGGPRGTELSVTRLSATQWWISLASAAIGTMALGAVMRWKSAEWFGGSPAAYPYWDAFTTIASLLAQWWMGRKKLESWWIWIVVDGVSIVLYYKKELYPTCGLYAVFLGLATWGYFEWRATCVQPVPATA